MTLPFSTKWPERMGELAGKPNYFPEKIWSGLKFIDPREWSALHSCYLHEYKLKVNEEWDNKYANIARAYIPKLHTIRHDPHNRWKPGMKIHPVINNRTKNRFQFAPVIECVSVQEIRITYFNNDSDYPAVRIDNDVFYMYENRGRKVIEQLALNDGFPSVESFFQYFNEDFKGKIIHWSDLKY